ncbi:MAG: hypothetical protein NC115_10120 [Bacteroidales bacterium]|nr:hypothetical protein [Bacteroidales bacterium]
MRKRIFFILLAMSLTALCSCGGIATDDKGKPDEEPGYGHTAMVRFEKSGNSEVFYVALQDKVSRSKYFVFSVNHYMDLSEEQYMNLWRLNGARLEMYRQPDGTFTKMVDNLLTNGENESVFRDYSDESTMADFTGGFHGDERIDLEEGCGVKFYIDDVELDASLMEKSFDWIGCDKFHYVQNSTMHKTGSKVDGKFIASDHRAVAGHVKTTVFDAAGYNTVNRLEFRESLPVYWYCGICCVGHSLAEKGYNEDFLVETFDSSGGNRLDGVGKNELHAWHDGNGVEVNISCSMLQGGTDGQCRMFVWDTGNYAKYYRRIPANGSMDTAPGTVLESVMDVRLNVR